MPHCLLQRLGGQSLPNLSNSIFKPRQASAPILRAIFPRWRVPACSGARFSSHVAQPCRRRASASRLSSAPPRSWTASGPLVRRQASTRLTSRDFTNDRHSLAAPRRRPDPARYGTAPSAHVQLRVPLVLALDAALLVCSRPYRCPFFDPEWRRTISTFEVLEEPKPRQPEFSQLSGHFCVYSDTSIRLGKPTTYIHSLAFQPWVTSSPPSVAIPLSQIL